MTPNGRVTASVLLPDSSSNVTSTSFVFSKVNVEGRMRVEMAKLKVLYSTDEGESRENDAWMLC